ncbi:MAG: ATP-binding cassette domain-containing protein [Actinobacteria bacterium]|nr:ATP-binding cassette domain-containing protein [Actinomycetota bacterium]MBU1944122.1 ATP-binding cassette domain-containing protein [Actinomycetota bacterium]MBU2686721.1 ATP-binding cassette domain-containing protein [Actinomycetota bacterium]
MVNGGRGRIHPVLAARDLRKVYQLGDSEVHALRGVSVAIEPGEMVAIVGASGSGKSTLLQIIGLLDRPTGGGVYVDGQDVGEMSDGELARTRNRKLGFIFQSFNLMPHETALDNVAVPLQYGGLKKKECRKMAEEALASVGLAERMEHRPNELSGGQRQRVAIARAIVTQPLVILADEPTGALDVSSGLEVLNILQEFNRQGRTIVIVTHDPNIAQQAGRIIRISDGLVVEEQRVEARTPVKAAPAPTAVPAGAPGTDQPRVCGQCGSANRAVAAFCRICGARFTEAGASAGMCAACGTGNRPSARYCRICGAGIATGNPD